MSALDELLTLIRTNNINKRASIQGLGFIDTAAAELAALRARVEEATELAEEIEQWAKAYPLHVFPEPDMKEVRRVLEAGGITLDCVSASNMRHVVTELNKKAAAFLHPTENEDKP